MQLCYIDESGTSDLHGNTSHYVLAGLAVPVWHWKDCDRDLEALKARYSLQGVEIHTAWILRSYLEQSRIAGFETMTQTRRRVEVNSLRKAELLRLQNSGNSTLYKRVRKSYRKTNAYVHLTHGERRQLILDVADCVSQWGFARLFAECIDKIHFDPSTAGCEAGEQAFEQVVSRFEHYLQNISQPGNTVYGLLIHDNNPTVEKKHTELMKGFRSRGTLWTSITNTIETPLYVNSELTALVQVADLCAYALRRYLENNEEDLFNLIFDRADRKNEVVVGVRHFTNSGCSCAICTAHRQ